MKIHVFDDVEKLNQTGADIIASLIRMNPRVKLGLATGTSPIGIYRKLANIYHQGNLSFKDVSSYNLDEYVGLPNSHPNSFYSEMDNNLFRHIDIDRRNVHIPNGEAMNLEAECVRYNTLLREVHPLDLQVLGVGENGHIGFNEPNRELSSDCHVVLLTEETRKINAAAFGDLEKVPKKAITMGIGDILKSKIILFVAIGERKAGIMKRLVYGNVSTDCPGSFLQLHSNVIVLLDREAANLL